MTDSATYAALQRFLKFASPEVEGRSGPEFPPEEMMEQLRQFAQGNLDETERLKVTAWLAKHPRWVSLLADEIKRTRTEPPSPDQP